MSEIKINGFNCRYELSGNLESNETIVFINGISSPLESWGEIKEDLDSNLKLLGYDMRGQWFSEVTNDTPYSFLTMADDLNALMEALDIENVHIVSTSLGGEVAQWFALKYPHKVRSLVLVATVSEANKLHITQVNRWKASAQKAVDAIDESSGNPDVLKKVATDYYDAILPELYSNTYLQNNADRINERINNFVSLCHRDFFQGHVYLCDMFFRLCTDEKITDRLHEIKCPTLVIAAEVDIIKPVIFSKIIADGIPDSKLVVLDDIGHAVFHEVPEELSLLIKEHISSCLPVKKIYESKVKASINNQCNF